MKKVALQNIPISQTMKKESFTVNNSWFTNNQFFCTLQNVHNSQTTKKKVSLQNAHHSQIMKKEKVALWRHAHKCVIFVHSQNAQRETKTHTIHDARIFGDDGIMSVITKMRRQKKQGQWNIDDVDVVVGITTLLLSIS
jgi:hypothetical protein